MINNPAIERVPAPLNKTFYDMTTLAETNDYHEKVGADMASCNTCHGDLLIHNEPTNTHSATDFAQCTSCHNATRAAYYPGRAADLKFQVHKLHSGPTMHGESLANDLGHGVKHYPAPINNCLQCHTEEQINLPLQENPRASFTKNSAFDFNLMNGVYTSPTTVVCTSCHISVGPGFIDAQGDLIASYADQEGNAIDSLPDEEQNIINHMILAGGAVFGAATAAEATGKEACATCHALGKEVGVDKMHNLADDQ